MEVKTNSELKNYEILPLGISGLGGWLVLVQIGLILSTINIILHLYRYTIPSLSPDVWNALTSEQSSLYHPLWGPAIAFDAIYNMASLAFCFFILFCFYSKKSILPRLMIILYAVNLIVSIIEPFWINQLLSAEENNDGYKLGGTFRAALTCLIWIPYFLKSERVRNTFIR